MTDILARQRQLIGTTAEWAADDLVLGNGEVAVERVSSTEIKIKIGDGVDRFSTLPYVAGGIAGGGASTIAGIAGLRVALDALIPKTDAVVATGALSANKVPKLDADGKIVNAQLNTVAVSIGAASAGKLALTGAQGRFDMSLMPLSLTSAMTYQGQFVPTLAGEYPARAPSNIKGDTYTVKLTAPYVMTTGNLVGDTLRNSDLMIYDGTNWALVDMVGQGMLKSEANLTYFHAPTFDATHTYASGDIVTHAGGMFKALSAIAAGAWNPAQWRSVIDFSFTFDQTKNYAVNEVVSHDGRIYAATATVTPAAWNPAQWRMLTPTYATGVEAARPAASMLGDVFYATDTQHAVVWNGVAWIDVMGGVRDGNFTVLGAARRFFAAFSDAITLRFLFQSSTKNGATKVTAVPNGTSNLAGFSAFNESAPTAKQGFELVIDDTAIKLIRKKLGASKFLPFEISRETDTYQSQGIVFDENAFATPKFYPGPGPVAGATFIFDGSKHGQVNKFNCNGATVAMGKPVNVPEGAYVTMFMRNADGAAKTYTWDTAFTFSDNVQVLTAMKAGIGVGDLITFWHVDADHFVYCGHTPNLKVL